LGYPRRQQVARKTESTETKEHSNGNVENISAQVIQENLINVLNNNLNKDSHLLYHGLEVPYRSDATIAGTSVNLVAESVLENNPLTAVDQTWLTIILLAALGLTTGGQSLDFVMTADFAARHT